MQLKKPKFWSYKKPNLLSWILWPISKFVELNLILKNKKPKTKFKIKTICVGNIYVGGTGKTSLAIVIHEILKKMNIKSCFVKKYYPNQTDEQKILQKYGKVFLSKSRVESLKEAEHEKFEFAIFDDGLQDYSINFDVKFICFNSINWIGNGMVIPSGPLRENIKNLKSYNNIFISGNIEKSENIIKYIYDINPKINLIFGTYEPTNLQNFNLNEKYIAFSGIGNHATFIEMLKLNNLKIVKDIEFPDHYEYSKNDINKIISISKELNCKIITTEKDFLRLENHVNQSIKCIKTKLNISDEQKLINAIFNLDELH